MRTPHCRMLLHEDSIREYAQEVGLTPNVAQAELDAAALFREGMSSGQPSVLLVAKHNGQLITIETSLQLLETIGSSMRAASGVPRAP